MTAFRSMGRREITGAELQPGDTVLTSNFTASTTNAIGAIIRINDMAGGLIVRSGATANYTDTLDTASNILDYLAGNNIQGPVVPGLSFRLRILNSVAFVETITLGNGMVAGLGTIASIPASSWREFLLTITSAQPDAQVIGTTVSGSPNVTWILPSGQASIPEGPAPNALNIMPGCHISGTGVPAGTSVISVTQGQGGTIGCVMSANAGSSQALTALSFGPFITVDGVGSGTL